MRKRLLALLAGIPALLLLGAFIYNLPPVNDRLSWRVDELRTRLKYALSPPEEAVFVPQEHGGTQPAELPPTPKPTTAPATPTPVPVIQTQAPTAAPLQPATLTPVPIPETFSLDGVVYVDQHNRWNYCGPANLAMALNYWGWPGTRDDIARVVKPGVADPELDFIQQGRWDVNVMPYEMTDFVVDQTDYNVVMRYGGEIELIQRLIAAGFPVLVEKGYYEADYTGKVAWLGHYLFTTGYDRTSGEFIVQDAYLEPGPNMRVDFETYAEGWRSFNYLFMVIYPPDREAQVFELLGPWADPAWANQHALEIADQETQSLADINEFFAWFNKGTSHVQLLQYSEAANAYDQAFRLYAGLEDDDNQRPYRIMWYQTGPYWGYYYTGRYQDLISLADNTLNETIAKPTLEESLYWRGLAKEALGDRNGAIADLREALRLNPNFGVGEFQLNRILGAG
jgi:hypothetical protein